MAKTPAGLYPTSGEEAGDGERGGERGKGDGGRGGGDNINYLVKIITRNKVFHFPLRN